MSLKLVMERRAERKDMHKTCTWRCDFFKTDSDKFLNGEIERRAGGKDM